MPNVPSSRLRGKVQFTACYLRRNLFAVSLAYSQTDEAMAGNQSYGAATHRANTPANLRPQRNERTDQIARLPE